MSHLDHNRAAWNRWSAANGVWSRPVDADTIRRARMGDWQLILTPRLPVPRDWFGEVRGKDVLCLASAGGQQAPVLAAAGARVVSFDLSDKQLARDREVAQREGLDIMCIQGDMADLSCLPDQSFDLIFHAASNMFVPDVRPVWREAHRVMRRGGSLLSGFMNPDAYLFDHDEADASGELVVRYRLPYSDLADMEPQRLQQRREQLEPLEFSHSLDDLLGGQIDAGFVITGFYEDRWMDDSWVFSRHAPVCLATRAFRP